MLLAALSCAGCHEYYAVICDSQCAQKHSWPNQINVAGADHPELPHFYVTPMPGVTQCTYDFPDHLRWLPFWGDMGVVIALGLNDVMLGTPVPEYRQCLSDMLEQARERALPTYCYLIPDMAEAGYDSEPYRQVQRELCGTRVLDVPIYMDDTPDAVHMGPVASNKAARQVLLELNRTFEL